MKKLYKTKRALNNKKKKPVYEKPEVLAVCLSGGIDSAVALGSILQGYPETKCVAISFMYPSKHNDLELECAKKLTEHYQVQHIVIDVSSIFECMNSSMINKHTKIPQGHYTADNMKSTVVPLRNIIFTNIAAANLMNMFPDKRILLCLGIHSGDHHIYPDCRIETNRGLAYTLMHGSEGKVALNIPFLHGDKTQIVALGNDIGVPFGLTRTCYTNESVACGKCGSCVERLEAFKLNNLKDPVKYEEWLPL